MPDVVPPPHFPQGDFRARLIYRKSIAALGRAVRFFLTPLRVACQLLGLPTVAFLSSPSTVALEALPDLALRFFASSPSSLVFPVLWMARKIFPTPEPFLLFQKPFFGCPLDFMIGLWWWDKNQDGVVRGPPPPPEYVPMEYPQRSVFFPLNCVFDTSFRIFLLTGYDLVFEEILFGG